MSQPEPVIRFAPSAVDGLPDVSEVAVFPDRLELSSRGKLTLVRFLDIARWHRHGWFYRFLIKLGFGVRGRAAVADRDWFHPPAQRYFRFYTKPPITIYIADEPIETDYGRTLFRRIQDVIASCGFETSDLG